MWTLALKIEKCQLINFIQARNEYDSLKAILLICFQHPQAPAGQHKKVVAVLSNYAMTIQANQIHKILNLALHPETVENVAPYRTVRGRVQAVQPTCLKYFMRKL